jgi:NAD(P)-dependent dehydrogenase (short-subunit alcohol dehydrogenase family)
MQALGKGGSIINVASITGIRPGVSAAAYASSKAAVIQMTRALAMEWVRYGIRVNALAPGYFETDLNRALLQSDYGQAMMKRIPPRRFGELAELDGPLLLLASNASGYMTGSVIAVDGGHLVSVL